MKWREIASIINTRMVLDERNDIARIDIQTPDGQYITEKAIKLVKDTFGVWTFVIGGAMDDEEE